MPRSCLDRERMTTAQVSFRLSRSAGNGFCAASKSVSGDGHTSALGNQISFSGMASGDVCVGDHWLDVMNPWEVLKIKVRRQDA